MDEVVSISLLLVGGTLNSGIPFCEAGNSIYKEVTDDVKYLAKQIMFRRA